MKARNTGGDGGVNLANVRNSRIRSRKKGETHRSEQAGLERQIPDRKWSLRILHLFLNSVLFDINCKKRVRETNCHSLSLCRLKCKYSNHSLLISTVSLFLKAKFHCFDLQGNKGLGRGRVKCPVRIRWRCELHWGNWYLMLLQLLGKTVACFFLCINISSN